jgi:hypothetical protein
MVNNGDVIAVWFSCGAASAVAAQETIRRYGNAATVRVIYNPVIEEDADNLRFLADIEQWLGISIERAVNPSYVSASAKDVWDTKKAMSFPLGAPCTVELKKGARAAWERNNRADWHVLGFTADEKHRHDRFVLTERHNVLPVLIDAKLRKPDCFARLAAAGIARPRIYDLGYPNANCIGCVKATSPTYWNLVRQQHPEVFSDRAEQSRRLGARLVRVKGQRKYLDELLPTDIGRALKSTPDCGIFCEEKP